MISNLLWNSALFLAASPPAGQPQPSPWPTFIMMGLLVVIFYFLLIRPQRLRQKELEKKIASLKIGDQVVTVGGIHGLVTNVKERTVVLKVADNVKIEFEKSSVSQTIPKEGGERKEPEEEKPKGSTGAGAESKS